MKMRCKIWDNFHTKQQKTPKLWERNMGKSSTLLLSTLVFSHRSLSAP